MLSCKECGHDCTEKDFERRINLCDHLYLDSLAKQTEAKKRQVDEASRQFSVREGMRCPRCHGLLVFEIFTDWPAHGFLGGCRCLCCGNIWDQVIATNRTYPGEVLTRNRVRKPSYR